MAISKTAPILVTGVNGFVAAWVALTLLRKGYSVRGTSRSQTKFDALVSNNTEFQKYAKEGKLTVEIIEDVATSDFTKAMQGVEVVLHTASPFHLGGGDAEAVYLVPAIRGTLNVLQAAHKAGTVKNFVLTSSFAAVINLGDTNLPFNGQKYTEQDWNPATYEESKNSQNARFNYCASKKLAEKAAYDYQKEHDLENKIRIASLNPPMIFGPFVHPVADLDQLNESVGQAYTIFSGKCGDSIPPSGFPALADVRDVAEAHIAAAETNAQGRFLLYGGKYDNIVIANIAKKDFPQLYKGPEPDASQSVSQNPKLFTLDNSKARTELGIQFKAPEQTIHDMLESFVNWKPKV